MGQLVLWSPLKQKGEGAAYLILRQPSRLLQTSALSWMHDAAASDCRSIPVGYENIEGLMQSGFVCWTDADGTAKVRSICDPRGLDDLIDTSSLKWVSEEKFSEFGSQNSLLAPIATSKFRTTPLEAEVFSYWERQIAFIAAAHCGNGKLDITEEPARGLWPCIVSVSTCQHCRSVTLLERAARSANWFRDMSPSCVWLGVALGLEESKVLSQAVGSILPPSLQPLPPTRHFGLRRALGLASHANQSVATIRP